jgi:hypothetical protein
VYILQNHAPLFPWLLMVSALGAAIGTVCGGPTWNEALLAAQSRSDQQQTIQEG